MHGSLASSLICLSLIAGCASPSASSPPSPSAAATGANPTAQATATPSAAPTPVVIELNAVAVTVSDRLRVRSEPRVGDDSLLYDPVLPLGTELFVLDGPVSASGYTWYKVAPASFAGLAGPGYGWVAAAGKDGEQWIAPAQGPGAGLAIAMTDVARAPAQVADARTVAASINAMSVDLHQRLVTDPNLKLQDKNVVFSPTSIAFALAMARAGARGGTATEMDAVLHAPAGWQTLGPGINALDQALNARNVSWVDGEGTKELILRLANAPFAQRDWAIERDYLDTLGSTFGAGLRLVDYAGDREAARNAINSWVNDRTAGRIPTLLTPDQVTPDTRLTLVNAIYFKAQWSAWFQEDRTQPAPFTRLDASRVSVPMMERWGGRELPYARGAGWQATELDYLVDGDSPGLSMLLVIPDDLRAFETGLTGARFEQITAAIAKERTSQAGFTPCPGVPADQQDAGCYPYSLNLLMPRFSVGTRAELGLILAALGMPSAFDPAKADFSGIHGPDPLYIARVIHEANIDVDEKGTEASAATAVGMDTGGGPSPIKDITLRLDRPFLFFVRDVETGAILFMGRITDPSDRRAE